jgi:parvulin-like peptidyl-prolyl isomerase
LWLLAAGALLGVSLADVGVLRPTSQSLPPGVVARVNDRLIRSESYERAWRMVASDKRNPMTDADRAHVLKRLIEEELLIQRGQVIGLLESDPTVRKSISVAMIQSIVAESEARQPDEAALRGFYQENLRYFMPPGAIHVRQIVFVPRPPEGMPEARVRARTARDEIAQGLPFADAVARHGDVPLVAIPDTPLPANKLQQYIGRNSLEQVRALSPLEVSQPFESAADVRIFQLVERSSPEPTPFEEIENWVESAFQRDAADRALREVLARLWRDADIALTPEAQKSIGRVE